MFLSLNLIAYLIINTVTLVGIMLSRPKYPGTLGILISSLFGTFLVFSTFLFPKILYGNLIKNSPIANNLNTPSESEIADFANILQKYIDEHQYIQVSFSKSKILADSGISDRLFTYYFNEYLQTGYYPFMMEDKETVHQKINQLIRTIVEYDMAELKDFDIRNAKKVLQLMYVIAQQVPFKPNLVTLSEKTDIHRNSLNNYLHYLEQAKLISTLQPAGKSTAVLQKPEKIYLNNTNLLFALAEQQVDTGNLRETFFLSQINVMRKITMPKQGDFFVDNKYTFEVGGKDKSRKQIAGIKNAWVVKGDLEYPIGNDLPLWIFGLLY